MRSKSDTHINISKLFIFIVINMVKQSKNLHYNRAGQMAQLEKVLATKSGGLNYNLGATR